MAISRKQALLWVLKELASHFERQGWHLFQKVTSSLMMTQEPGSGIQHILLVHAPFRPNDLPSPDVVGLSCAINVYFPELEKLIDEALHRDWSNRLSMRLPLSQLVPAEHLYAGNVHLIHVGADVQQAVQVFVSDFAAYLEPERRRLCMTSVFEEDGYQPRAVSPWSWRLRRAAYYARYMDAARRQALFAELNQQADAVLGMTASNDQTYSKIFTNIATLQRESILHGANELRRFLLAVQ